MQNRHSLWTLAWQAYIIWLIAPEFTTNLIRKIRRVASFPTRLPSPSSGDTVDKSVTLRLRGISKLVQSYHEGHRVRDDLIIRDCSSTEVDGGTAGDAVKGLKRREGGRGENLSGLPHSGTDLQGCRCFTTPQSAARSLSTRAQRTQIYTRHTYTYIWYIHTHAYASANIPRGARPRICTSAGL